MLPLPLSENHHLLKWVEKMADLTKPAAIHWVDGSAGRERSCCAAQMVAGGTFIKLNRGALAGLLLRAVRRQRCRARRGPDLHLFALKGQRRPDQQLGQTRSRCARS